ncbi:MAG: ABC transporter permease subunit, partial [Pseudohongiellaceae bacterium]
LFLVYYGLAQFDAVRESIFWRLLKEPYWCALLVFSLNTAAYSARIFHGAMEQTDRGEWEAALAYGFLPRKRLTRVVIPAAWRRALPAYGNEMIFLMHGSSVASIVTLLDLTGAARVAARGTFHFSESYLLAILLYMLLSAAIILIVRQTEKHARRHLQPAN